MPWQLPKIHHLRWESEVRPELQKEKKKISDEICVMFLADSAVDAGVVVCLCLSVCLFVRLCMCMFECVLARATVFVGIRFVI